jgi:hypothetical protein
VTLASSARAKVGRAQAARAMLLIAVLILPGRRYTESPNAFAGLGKLDNLHDNTLGHGIVLAALELQDVANAPERGMHRFDVFNTWECLLIYLFIFAVRRQ